MRQQNLIKSISISIVVINLLILDTRQDSMVQAKKRTNSGQKRKDDNKNATKHVMPSASSKSKDHKSRVHKDKEGIVEKYKDGLLNIDKQEEKFDKLFEQKLSQQYKEFRSMKEHHVQITKFYRIFIVLVTVILIALLLISYG